MVFWDTLNAESNLYLFTSPAGSPVKVPIVLEGPLVLDMMEQTRMQHIIPQQKCFALAP